MDNEEQRAIISLKFFAGMSAILAFWLFIFCVIVAHIIGAVVALLGAFVFSTTFSMLK